MGIAAELDASTVIVIALLMAGAMVGVATKYGIDLSRNGYSRTSKSMVIASVTICLFALAFAWLLYAVVSGSGY